MRQTILGRKLGMTQIFDRQGNAIPITIVQAGPCTVLQVKTAEIDGYNAIQLGFGDKKEKHTTKPLLGHFKKADSPPLRHIREARVEDPTLFRVGQVITTGLFEKDDMVDVTGTSKGKGFAGVMKRHGFGGFMASHGVHESKRGPGSIGQSADPAKVFKGMRMPGQMGSETVTVQNLRIVDVRESQNLIMVQGPVPGGKNGLLVISHAIKKAAPAMRQIEPEEEDVPVEETPEDLPAGEGPQEEQSAADNQPVGEPETAAEETPEPEREPAEDGTPQAESKEPADEGAGAQDDEKKEG